jgi:hypothetical protein
LTICAGKSSGRLVSFAVKWTFSQHDALFFEFVQRGYASVVGRLDEFL